MSEQQISIIIPALNEEKNLGRLLPLLQKNAVDSPPEIIIADGGSSDNTHAIAEKHRVKLKHCKKKGRAAQMNEGAEEAAGTILYFLHADTIPPENFDVHIAKAVQEGYGSGCFQLTFNDPHPILRLYAWFTRFRTTLVRFGDQSLFVEKKLFRSVGGFDETLTVMEDQKIVRELKRKSSFKVMKAHVTTSARRYKQNGIIRLQSVFGLIFILYYLGGNQNILTNIYQRFIKEKR